VIITIKPAPGIVLHNPGNFMRPISEEGTQVEDNAYWRRRIADGDAVIVEAASPAPAPPAAPALPAAPHAAPAAQPIPATDAVLPRSGA
jgi:hypothetical protein